MQKEVDAFFCIYLSYTVDGREVDSWPKYGCELVGLNPLPMMSAPVQVQHLTAVTHPTKVLPSYAAHYVTSYPIVAQTGIYIIASNDPRILKDIKIEPNVE